MRLVLPTLYVILDAGMLTEPAGVTAQKLMDAGVKLLQYRAKNAAARELWAESRTIAELALRAKPNINAWLNDLIERELAAQANDWREILNRPRPVATEAAFEQCLKPE